MEEDSRILSFKADAKKALGYLHGEFAKLQTGRASAAMVEHVHIKAYEQKQELRALAGITVQDARSIVIQPWDRGILRDIEIGLQEADLGCMPVNDGSLIRLNLPPMTQERRLHLTKVIHKLAEESKISIRKIRQEVHDDIKENTKEEDLRYTLLEQLDMAVKDVNGEIESSAKKKEEDIMTI
jgi:ribosome recycling factor